jgi:hypothetical protein
MNTLPLGAQDVDLATPVAVLLAAAAGLAIVRVLYRQWRAEPAQRSRTWRVALRVLAQPLCAALLYFALFPPTVPGEAATLVVATAGATTRQLEAAKPGEALVALPEAPALPDAERVPDLATALRRHPGTRRIRVVGVGLEARDRDVTRGMPLEFIPAPLPRGLVELGMPPRVAAGDEFRVAGRAEGLRGGTAELLDPGRQPVDRAALDADGRFVVSATTRVPGAATYRLRLRDAQQRPVDDVELPQRVEAGFPPRVLLLVGAPNAEAKYLRRWARDAGLEMHTQIAAGGGLELGDAPLKLDAAELSRFDMVVLDERAWSALGDARRAALNGALRGGLGVLLRVTAALSDAEQRRLAELGFQVDAGRESTQVHFAPRTRADDAERARLGPGTRDAPRAPDAAVPEVPTLTRRTMRMTADDALPLLLDGAGTPLATWQASGRGRVALWTLTDSYRLVLAGRGDLHGELWSRAIATLARPRARAKELPDVTGEAWQDERVVVCGVGDGSHVFSPGGSQTALLRDPSTGTRACAGFWPRESGWHRLQFGDQSRLFYVRARNAAKGLHAAAMREATRQIATESHLQRLAAVPASEPRHPGPRWPWWLAWLLASAGLWWLERSRAGRVVREAVSR